MKWRREQLGIQLTQKGKRIEALAK